MRIYCLVWLLALSGWWMNAPAQEESIDYSIADLLQPCMEGDNDAREQGFIAEMQCEQYIRGFVDGYLLLSDEGKTDNVCLPEQNQADEVRWAFMRWAHDHYDERNQPAAEGLIAVIKNKFGC